MLPVQLDQANSLSRRKLLNVNNCFIYNAIHIYRQPAKTNLTRNNNESITYYDVFTILTAIKHFFFVLGQLVFISISYKDDSAFKKRQAFICSCHVIF